VQFYAWGLYSRHSSGEKKPNHIQVEIRDPVEAVRWLDSRQDSVLIAHNLHLFLDIPEVVQAIQNGVPRWKQTRFVPCDDFAGYSNTAGIGEDLHGYRILSFQMKETLFHLQMELAQECEGGTKP